MTTNNTAMVAANNNGGASVIRARSGKAIGTRQVFSAASARDVKAGLKRAGVKGAELTRRVNEVLRGERDLREQLGFAWVQATIQSGFTPDVGEVRKNSAVLRFVKPSAEKAVAPAAVTPEAALAALGLSAEDLELIKGLKQA